MNRSVGEKVVCHRVSAVNDVTIGGNDGSGRPPIDEGEQVVVKPYRNHEDEGHARRVEEEVDLVKSVRLIQSRRVCGHNLLEEDVGGDEYDG